MVNEKLNITNLERKYIANNTKTYSECIDNGKF